VREPATEPGLTERESILREKKPPSNSRGGSRGSTTSESVCGPRCKRRREGAISNRRRGRWNANLEKTLVVVGGGWNAEGGGGEGGGQEEGR